MRLATIVSRDGGVAALVRGDRCLPVTLPGLDSVRLLAAAGDAGLERLEDFARIAEASAWRPLDGVTLAPAVPDPGAIYTIGHNYRSPGESHEVGLPRPLVYGKAASSVGAHGATLGWDRAVTDNVDAEVELAVVVGAGGRVFGYTVIDDVSSRDEWLDGDQWLLGKSMPGFCPVGPWVVTADELDPGDLRLECRINDEPIQDGTTRDMRFAVADVLAFLGRHIELRPGDLIATGTPPRLATPPGPGRRLRAGDVVACRIEGIGELVTHIG
jgi:2-keto-4-pentenoate hydratase/2-oxohepta-3-ene-1,7-dioic acid hydratase in catechol pathway